MALVSSPMTYPPSSSPPEPTDVRKRRCPEDEPATSKVKKRLFGRNPFDAIGQARGVVQHTRTTIGDSDVSKSVDNEPSLPNALISSITQQMGSTHRACTSSPEESDIRPKDSNTRFGFRYPKGLDASGIDSSGLDASTASLTYGLTSSGKRYFISERKVRPQQTYESLVAERSTTAPGRAVKSYYGVDIHKLVDEASELLNKPATEPEATCVSEAAPAPAPKPVSGKRKRSANTMWTEKYRARKFTDLVGDERTHRTVLRWLKHWDPIVFPGAKKSSAQRNYRGDNEEGSLHRKILLLTGPPGLGKTTLAHVCARQAGYEVVEINASDERSRDVVKGRIRDSVGTENVRGINKTIGTETVREAGRPVCVVVDEVDGVVGGSGASGDGGFMKALIDLVMLDQKNSRSSAIGATRTNGKKGDRFRLLRPMILICNDVYHPALRPVRSSNLAEIVHVRKPPLDKIVARMRTVFEKEGVQADGDGVRRLCEATWGISGRRDERASSSNTGEGDIRGVLVVGEWAAGKLRASAKSPTEQPRLTKRWVEQNMISDLSSSGSGARGIGRGGAKETADRIFMENAGFPRSTTTVASTMSGVDAKKVNISVSELAKGHSLSLLREAVDTCGDHDRIVSDAFTAYPSRPFQDDIFLSKPNSAHEWLHFHDKLSSRVHSGQEWELMPYLSSSILGFHYLFGSSAKSNFGSVAASGNDAGAEDPEAEMIPFSGPRADFDAYEAHKHNRAVLQSLQASLSAPLQRTFRSPEELATELLPQLIRLLTPNVQPVVVGGGGDQRGTASVRRESERAMVARSAEAMVAVGVEFHRTKVEDERGGYGGFIYRMEPPLDTLATFQTTTKTAMGSTPTRFAVRQVLDQEFQKFRAKQAAEARQARFTAGGNAATRRREVGGDFGSGMKGLGEENKAPDTLKAPQGNGSRSAGVAKRDFFGRVVKNEERPLDGDAKIPSKAELRARVWVSFNEGFSNAVRKPISLNDLMTSL